jgi:hypothetical protein
MGDDADISLDEKRVHGDDRPRTRLVVASDLGLATVEVSDDQIGRFGLAHRLLARDVAGEGHLAVATADDVLVGDADRLARTAFQPAVAVGFRDDGALLAAGENGRVARWDGRGDGDLADGEWATLGTVEGEVRAIDGDLIAGGTGVHRAGAGLDRLGAGDVRDVAIEGQYAATAEGVQQLADEWTRAVAGDATVVASDGNRAHVVVDGTLLERRGEEWVDAGCPVADVVDVAYAESTYAVTGNGTVLVDPATAKDGVTDWRSRELGLEGVAGLAVL